jgi:hypothetical protein
LLDDRDQAPFRGEAGEVAPHSESVLSTLM